MKRILVVLMLLSMVVGAYAVSGKIFARFNKQGPVFEYWAGGGNNVDLWQQKDGTGFDIGFDTFGLTYKTRPALAIPFGLEDNVFAAVWTDVNPNDKTNASAAGFDENYWGRKLKASSPGYFKLRDIKFGSFAMQIGFSWTQAFATSTLLVTNTNGTTNANSDGSIAIAFNKFYVDYKFDLPLGDMITIKQYDWDLMHFEYAFGDTKLGNNATQTNTWKSGSSFLAYVPLQVLINLNAVALTLSPLFVYDTTTTSDTGNAPVTNNIYNPNQFDNFKTNNVVTATKMKAGAYARANIGLNDVFSIYVMAGGFLTTSEDFNRTVIADVTAVTTNSRSTSSMLSVPAFAGLIVKMGPGIKMTLGWGMQYTSYTSIADSAGTNLPGVTTTSWINRYGAYDNGVKAEFATYGDNFMDLAFLRFGSDAKFAGNWSVGIAGGVALNDEWTYPWYVKYQNGVTTSGIGSATVTTSGANQLFSFINFMNYDRQMYIKYEDENVAIKGTISQEGNYDGASSSYQTQLFGMFEYVDLTIKF